MGSMRERCNNPNHRAYASYGGRGISVCARWDDFAAFAEDVGERPSKDHSLDRIDVNGNYEPSNCRWATKSEQSNNRRDNRHLVVRGQMMSHKDAAELLGVPYQALREASRRSESFDAEAYAANFQPLRKVTPEIATKIVEMRKAGSSSAEISVSVGLSKAKVTQVLNGRDGRWRPYDYFAKAA